MTNIRRKMAVNKENIYFEPRTEPHTYHQLLLLVPPLGLVAAVALLKLISNMVKLININSNRFCLKAILSKKKEFFEFSETLCYEH